NAAAWDRQRGSDLIEMRWLDRFAALLPEGGSVLDLGCGSGNPIASNLIARGYKVTGLDSSASLIALCRGRFPAQEWIVGDMRKIDLARRFSGLIAWHSFFHLNPDDQRQMFQRFAGHSAPGGALMFTSGPDAGEVLGEWRGEPLYHASLDPEEYRRLLDSNGYALVDHELRDPECGHATVWLARSISAAGV
ncbi:MAG TPA: class I SAM-dependent methyltransferase, partial [Allosphingosinicella sp.]|nr:class I SAM-dependent methyltransferase [Allosphingosinicella sp.]